MVTQMKISLISLIILIGVESQQPAVNPPGYNGEGCPV